MKLHHSLLRAWPRHVVRHPDTAVKLDDCGAWRPWVKTFRYRGEWLDQQHEAIATAPLGRMGVSFLIDVGIDGFLAAVEAAKLYELAYFTRGDVLELGTFKGLSASIISAGLRARGSGELVTVDLDAQNSAAAAKNIAAWGDVGRISFRVGDAAAEMDRLIEEGRKFGFIFVDHWHGYHATREAALRIRRLLGKGGFVQFHDYNDASARDPQHPDKVWQAVNDTIVRDSRFRFCCVTASSGVFQKHRGGRSPCTAAAVPSSAEPDEAVEHHRQGELVGDGDRVVLVR